MYYYDAAGQLIGFIVNGSTYYYVRNVQGDIIKILDGNMEEVVEYKYDTWGRVIGMEGSDYGKWVGSLNPFRYRGYYYDDETGMYYLITRYYNPEWGRFINADGTLIGNVGNNIHNIFAYAANNPVVYSDPSGMGVLYSPGCKTYTTGTEVTNYVITSTGENHYSDRVQEVQKYLNAKGYLTGAQLEEIRNKKKEAAKKYNPSTVNVCISEAQLDPNALVNVKMDGENNFRIWDSYKIRDWYEMSAVLDAVMENWQFDPNIYSRTKDSYMREWIAHNRAYDVLTALNIESLIDNVAHVDLNTDENKFLLGIYVATSL